MSRKMNPSQMLRLVRRVARNRGYSVAELGKSRGKGSHSMYALVDSDGTEVARFGLTGHPRDMSWEVLRQIEDGLAPWLGTKWTEER